ncbi:MAG: hypothetical protein QM762_17855 [Chryseolinea sp.]
MNDNVKDLEAARFELRKVQYKSGVRLHGFPFRDEENTLMPTLELLNKHTQFTNTKDPERIKRGFFSFHRQNELERIKVARELIIRTEPGPFEDPNYMALMAYQAASVEMIVRMLKKDMPPSKFLLGTVHDPFVNAFAKRYNSSGYTLIVLHSALIEFIYQAVKVVVELLKPANTNSPNPTVELNDSSDKIKQVMKKNPLPVERLFKTLESYFYLGYPRAFAHEIPDQKQQGMISICTAMAERWVIAHEYGHGLFTGYIDPEKVNNRQWVEEYIADSNATICTVYSAAKLDGLPPEFALSGASFSLACLEVLRRAYSIVTEGISHRDEGTDTHPPNKARVKQTIDIFKQFFDVRYGDRKFEVDFLLRLAVPDNHIFGDEHIKRMHFNSRLLFNVWDEVKQMLEEQYHLRRKLHHMWQ